MSETAFISELYILSAKTAKKHCKIHEIIELT